MKKSHLVVLILVILTVNCMAAKQLPKIQAILPAETVAILEIDDLEKCREKLEKTGLGKLCEDPAMQPFVNAIKEKIEKNISDIKNDIADLVLKEKIWPQGKVFFALVLDETAREKKEPTAVFLAQWGQNAEKAKEALEKTLQMTTGQDGYHRKQEQFRDVKIDSLFAEEGKRLKYGFNRQLHMGFIDDCLVGSESLDVLKFVIAHLKGSTAKSLAEKGQYQTAFKKISQNGQGNSAKLYVNIKQIMDFVISQNEKPDELTETMARLGLDNVELLAYVLNVDEGSQNKPSLDFNGVLTVDGDKKGLLKMMDMKSRPMQTEKFIGNNCLSLYQVNVDMKQFFEQIIEMVSSFNPQAAAMFYMPLNAAAGEEPVNFVNGFVEHLGQGVVVTEMIKKPFEKNKMPSEVVAAIAITNKTQLEKTVSSIHGQYLPQTENKIQLLGYTLYLMDVTHIAGALSYVTMSQGQEVPKLAIVITDSYMIVGFKPAIENIVRSMVAGDSDTVESQKWFQRAKNMLPQKAGGLGAVNLKMAAEILCWQLKEKAQEISKSPEAVDFSKLPKFETVAKYFGLAASYIQSKPDGFYFGMKCFEPIE